ncbi:Glyco_hydro_19_cat domain-containing protein [Psidium guajava]|nr:Glyco_hydro_19_cat domain-containing protein [Psidium guajava]
MAGICKDGRGVIVAGFVKEESASSVMEMQTLGVLQPVRVVRAERHKRKKMLNSVVSFSVLQVEQQRMDILTDNVSIPNLLTMPEESPWGLQNFI